VQGGGSTGPVSPLAGAVRGNGQYQTFTGTGQGQGTGQATGHFVAAPGRGGGGAAIPERPPPGTYDPALDAQEGQAVRGYGDLVSDTQRNRRYTSEDYQRAVGDTNYQANNQLTDLKTAGVRETQGYNFGQQYRTEDFNAATGERQRQYGLLGQRQGSEIAASGLSGSGAGVLAARIRAANQGREQGLAATDYNRASGQAAIAHWQALQDSQVSQGRVEHARTKSLGDLGIQVGRTRQGYTTTLGRASRELNQFKVDTNRSRFYEARSNQRWKPKKSLVKALRKRGLVY
jgi:hypothetical protein